MGINPENMHAVESFSDAFLVEMCICPDNGLNALYDAHRPVKRDV